MTLSERLIKLTEEKTKLECENQTLRENCIAWQNACQLRDKCLDDYIKRSRECSAERHKYFMENIDLKGYNESAKIVLERCGAFLSRHRKSFGISDYFIKNLGLDLTAERHEERLQPAKEAPDLKRLKLN